MQLSYQTNEQCEQCAHADVADSCVTLSTSVKVRQPVNTRAGARAREAHLPQSEHQKGQADGAVSEERNREEEGEGELCRVPCD